MDEKVQKFLDALTAPIAAVKPRPGFQFYLGQPIATAPKPPPPPPPDPRAEYHIAAEACPRDLNPIGWRVAVAAAMELHRNSTHTPCCTPMGRVAAACDLAGSIAHAIRIVRHEDFDNPKLSGHNDTQIARAYYRALEPAKRLEGPWRYRGKR